MIVKPPLNSSGTKSNNSKNDSLFKMMKKKLCASNLKMQRNRSPRSQRYRRLTLAVNGGR